MQDPQSLHKYAYVHGDPVNGIDPTGKFLVGTILTALSSIRATSMDTSRAAAGREAAYASLSAIVGGGIGGVTYGQLGLTISKGVRYGGVLGLGFHIARRQPGGLKRALKAGAVDAGHEWFSLVVANTLAWGLSNQNVAQVIQDALDDANPISIEAFDKVFPAFVNGFWGAATNPFHTGRGGVTVEFVSIIDAAITSIIGDITRQPIPEFKEISINAVAAASQRATVAFGRTMGDIIVSSFVPASMYSINGGTDGYEKLFAALVTQVTKQFSQVAIQYWRTF